MSSKKLLTVVGARPQFVKAAMVSHAVAAEGSFTEVLVHTGQHFDANMSSLFFAELAIPPPKYNLEIHSLNHGAMTGRMLEKLEEVILLESPNFVVVYGDTNSTLAGALAARKLQVPVAHVEAGLRSLNLRMPEEVNRILTDRISDLLCCPTERAVQNLESEGFDAFPSNIVLTGDVMQDAAMYYSRLAERSRILDRLGLRGRPFALCTLHRAENTDDPRRLTSIINALHVIALEEPVVLPIHPRTAAAIKRHGVEVDVVVIDPVGYLDMISLLKGARAVLTDSGGIQKEAFFFERPCVTLREETEWLELVEGGFNWLAGANTDVIIEAYHWACRAKLDYSVNLYGRGHASYSIVKSLRRQF